MKTFEILKFLDFVEVMNPQKMKKKSTLNQFFYLLILSKSTISESSNNFNTWYCLEKRKKCYFFGPLYGSLVLNVRGSYLQTQNQPSHCDMEPCGIHPHKFSSGNHKMFVFGPLSLNYWYRSPQNQHNLHCLLLRFLVKCHRDPFNWSYCPETMYVFGQRHDSIIWTNLCLRSNETLQIHDSMICLCSLTYNLWTRLSCKKCSLWNLHGI